MDPLQRAQLRAENALGVVRCAARMLRERGHHEDADALDAYVARLDHDDPLFDCTDGAHPAWWRGHDYTARRFGDLAKRFRAAQKRIDELLAEHAPYARGTPIPDLPPTLREASVCDRCRERPGGWHNVIGRACWLCDACAAETTRCTP